MNWIQNFSTSIGKKLQMSLTGIFLMFFLVVHCYINAQIFYCDQGERFNEAAHFMGKNVLIRTVEIGLFVLLILHIVQGLMLWSKNRARRATYAVTAGNKTSKWYSRSMALLGTLILLFLIIHLGNYWVPNRVSSMIDQPIWDLNKYWEPYSINAISGANVVTNHELNMFAVMKDEFTNLWLVVIYVLGCFSLAWHLLHGFYSAFQTLGLCTVKYKGIIKLVGVLFSIIIPLIFAMMPVAFYLGLIH